MKRVQKLRLKNAYIVHFFLVRVFKYGKASDFHAFIMRNKSSGTFAQFPLSELPSFYTTSAWDYHCKQSHLLRLFLIASAIRTYANLFSRLDEAQDFVPLLDDFSNMLSDKVIYQSIYHSLLRSNLIPTLFIFASDSRKSKTSLFHSWMKNWKKNCCKKFISFQRTWLIYF